MPFSPSITVDQIRGLGQFGKTLAGAATRLSALISLGLDLVDNTPDNLKPVSLPVQNALDTINSDISGLNSTVSTLSSEVTALQPHAYATTDRPAASSVAIGAEIWDMTLQIPLWSDQVNWYDATGTVR